MQSRRGFRMLVALVALSVAGCGQDSPYAPFRDQGDPATVAEIRDAVPTLIEAENAVGRLVPDSDGLYTSALNTSSAAIERRRRELSVVATPERARNELEVIEPDIVDLISTPADADALGFTQAIFELDIFSGVAVEEDIATVVLRGAECYRDLSGKKACEAPSDFRLTLHASPKGGWVIAEKISQPLAGLGP